MRNPGHLPFVRIGCPQKYNVTHQFSQLGEQYLLITELFISEDQGNLDRNSSTSGRTDVLVLQTGQSGQRVLTNGKQP